MIQIDFANRDRSILQHQRFEIGTEGCGDNIYFLAIGFFFLVVITSSSWFREDIFMVHKEGSQDPKRGKASTIILVPQHVTSYLLLLYEDNFLPTTYN